MKALLQILDRVRLAIGCAAACWERVRLATGSEAGGEGLGTLGGVATGLGGAGGAWLAGGAVGVGGTLGAWGGGPSCVPGLGATAGGLAVSTLVGETLVVDAET